MAPYVHEDDNGNTLTIDCGGHYAEVDVDQADGPFRAFPEDLPKITRALYEAADQPPPVILGLPDFARRDTEGVEWGPSPDSLLRVRRDRDRVTVRTTMDGGAAVLAPAAARAMAAVLATLADQAEQEPDPEQVTELTEFLRHAVPRTGSNADFAHAALLWMKVKAARDA